jgi:hypothetical protein
MLIFSAEKTFFCFMFLWHVTHKLSQEETLSCAEAHIDIKEFIPYRKKKVTITKISWLILFKGIAVYCEKHTKHLNTKLRVINC